MYYEGVDIMDPIINSFNNYILDNLPQILGIALATILLGILGWIANKIFSKPESVNPRPEERRSSDSVVEFDDDELINQYLADLIRRGSTLSFGDPASWSVNANGSGSLVTLDQIWTPLRVADSQTRKGKSGTHESMAEAHLGVDLKNLFDTTTEPLIILGDPGSGKSTSLAMLAVDTAREWQTGNNHALFPIWVSLAAVVFKENTSPEELLLTGVSEIDLSINYFGVSGGKKLERLLRNMIINGKALLLLDGLDEVGDQLLAKVRSAISQIVGLKNGSRVIVTCRTFDYRQSNPIRKVPIDRELELLPYSPDEQMLYVKRWYDAAVRIGRFSAPQAEDLSTALIIELHNEEISELAESPLLLALLTLIHSEEAKLPDTRAVVADRAIKYMLADAARWRAREAGASTIATPPILSLAIEIAHASYLEEERISEGESTGITPDMVISLAEKICEIMKWADPQKKVPTPDALAQQFLRSHGLLLDIGNGKYRFAHRSFQEFLAGQYYAAGAHHEDALEKASSIHWREPFRLMASFAGHEGENLYYILNLISELLLSSSSPISSIQLGAEMLTEIGRRRLALRQFNSVLSANGLWEQAQMILAKHVESSALGLAERERSASALGLLGDPRFTNNGTLIPPCNHIVELPSATLRIGSTRPDRELVKKSGGFVADPRSIHFHPFKIGRYPITNAEFRLFVESDGYTNLEYWDGDMASGWVSGDSKILEFIRNHWLETLYEHHAKEIRDGEIDVRRIEEESLKRTAPRTAPFYWHDRRFNRPNQPVVGINWWEAHAFCKWATKTGHETGTLDPDYIIDLPTEFEWEYASRPAADDRIYPWGDEWSDLKAHVSSNILNMRQPAPVGIYLAHWPNGPFDMAGNVWEWTLSLHLPYSKDYDSKRFSVDSIDERVVRGSSWLNTSVVAACSVRCVDRSYNLFYDVGFRIVCFHKNFKSKRL